jgi:SpoVK/Ycf46/Vps4 family AAA+-type ATPase
MATSNQIIALIESRNDKRRFYTIASQIAAREIDKGHKNMAEKIQRLIKLEEPSELVELQNDTVKSLLSVSCPANKMQDLILPMDTRLKLESIILEQKAKDKLYRHGFTPKRKILLIGTPGSGKTMTASVLAGELGLPLIKISYGTLFSSFLGETGKKLQAIFEEMTCTKGLYFFDEFDAIGSQRSGGQDVGEIRRVLNLFLIHLENDQSESLIVAATNLPELLDYALFRRFDDVIEYALPTQSMIRAAIKNRLSQFSFDWNDWTNILKAADKLNLAEILKAVDDATKATIIEGNLEIKETLVCKKLSDRQKMNLGKFS